VSTLVVVSFDCEPTAASAVVRAAETHPYTAKAVFDEQLSRCHVVLDLYHLHHYPERACERERVERWLIECRDARPPRTVAWPDHLAAKGMSA